MNKLKEELQDVKYTGKTDQECLDMLNVKDIPVKSDILIHDIRKYLVLNGAKLIRLEKSSKPFAVVATRMLEVFDTFSMDEPEVEAAVNAMLDSLVSESIIDTKDKANILNLGITLISRAEEVGLGNFRLGHITGARI